jgi:UDP-N-acetylglucosamine 4,6-dehydratase
VVPVFLEQRQTGKIMVTDPRMTRFWLTLEQGVEFVIRCAELMQGGEIFVPRIPSMKILDLVEAIAPGCEIGFSGIRPGEKLNEVLISQDEARHTIALEDMFAIYPEMPWWGESKRVEGKNPPDGFAFTSDANEHWLSIGELRRILDVS